MLTRIEEVAPSLTSTFASLIYSFALCIWNKTTVENLITALSDSEVSISSRTVAHKLLKDLALTHPKLFTNVLPTLANWIIEQANQLSSTRSREDKQAAEDILKTVARLEDVDLTGRQEKDFVDALTKFALEGETEKQGRRATAILLKMKRRDIYAEELVNVPPLSSKLTTGNCTFVEIRK